MRFGSVCSGIEAASVAWHPLGWRPSFFAEIDAAPRAVLKHHYPHVPLHGDFTTIKASEYDPTELLVGGTPCQSFSVAGLRGGLDDERGNLALGYLKLADRLRPRWLVWENVPGVLSSAGGRDFGSILGGMVELGYGVAYRVLDAQFVRVDGLGRAVPQRRRRVFVVGHLGDWQRAAAVLFECESLSGHPPPRREAGQGVARDVAPSLTGSGRGVERPGETRGQDPIVAVAYGGNRTSGPLDVATAVNAHGGPHGRLDFESETFVAHALRADGFDARANGGGQVAVAFAENSRAELRLEGGDGQVCASLKVGGGKAGQSYPAVAVSLRGREGGGMIEMGDDVAMALRASQGGGDKPHALVNWAVRRLTPRECERLQGFPDDYTLVPYRGKPMADGPRYKALGNSMAVNVMRWIGRRIEVVERIAAAREEAA